LLSLLTNPDRRILSLRKKYSLRRNPMTAKSKSREPRSQRTDLPNDIEERIRQRAHELYAQRGRLDGFALDDWFQAEAEVLGAQEQQKVRAARG
jgi:hypothetical protein